MIISITLILSGLILINFLLLIFSSNKTDKSLNPEQPIIIRNRTLSTENYSTVSV